MKYFFVIKEEYRNSIHRMDGKAVRGIYNEKHLNEIIQRNEIQNYRKLSKFKIGSLVKLVNYRPDGWNPQGGMDHYKGKIVEITNLDSAFFRIEDGGMWSFRPSDIEEVIKF